MLESPSALARFAGRILTPVGKQQLPAPEPQSVAALSERDQLRLFDFLRVGKLPLFRADPADPDGPSLLTFPALDTDVLATRLAEERLRCDGQRQAYLRARDLLAKRDIPVLLFKTCDVYPYTSSNVDALVPRGELGRATRTLEEGGHHEMVHYWEPNKRLLREFDGCRVPVMMHLHEQIAWLVLAFSDLDALWSGARASADPNVLHPAPEHVVAALLAHPVYESRRISLGDVFKLRSALEAPGFDWEEVARVARARSWLPGLSLSRAAYASAERIVFGNARLDARQVVGELAPPSARTVVALRDSELHSVLPVELGYLQTRLLFFRKLVIDNPRTLLQKGGDLLGVASQIGFGRLGLRKRPTSFVAVCGIDGSGKSTHADAVRRALAECELEPSEVWMRGGFSEPLERLKRGLRRVAPSLPGPDDEAAKTGLYRSSRLGWLFAWAVVFEQVLTAALRVRWARLRGRFPVAERYVPDTLADLAERLDDPQFPRRLPGWLLRALTPAPDLLVFLDLPGDVAFARKADAWSAEILEERRGRYLDLLGLYPDVTVLDATRGAEEIQDELIDLVLRHAMGRIRSRNPLSRQRRDGWE